MTAHASSCVISASSSTTASCSASPAYMAPNLICSGPFPCSTFLARTFYGPKGVAPQAMAGSERLQHSWPYTVHRLRYQSSCGGISMELSRKLLAAGWQCCRVGGEETGPSCG